MSSGGKKHRSLKLIKRTIANRGKYAIAPSPKPKKEMMITTRLAPIQTLLVFCDWLIKKPF
jgi:hypothetical protein